MPVASVQSATTIIHLKVGRKFFTIPADAIPTTIKYAENAHYGSFNQLQEINFAVLFAESM
ncbi:hypothetical protein GCM10007875_12280 [Limnobacter litoralis]|uniref:Uncharacterized protein n=1 Tax=Limnobacter litoralis TaxID=481366 RepID=A0ABQ5YQR8_9BURK|nr:hypothetical protein GCM10007875_12280 [Limnobacter litoralis]